MTLNGQEEKTMAITLLDNDRNQLDANFLSFSGGERHVQLGDFKGQGPYILRANLLTPTDVFDMLLLANALTEKFENPNLHIEIPYLPYARQDRVCAQGQAFSLKVFANILNHIENVDELTVWDCHSAVGLALTGAKNIAPKDIIKTSPTLTKEIVDLNSVIICPDAGAVERTQSIANAFEKDMQIVPIVYCEKVRDPATGNITHTEVKTDNLAGMTAIITDDICDGGYTFIKLAEQLKAKGAARVILYVTHGIFSKGLDVFDGLIDHIYTTQSFPQSQDKRLSVINFHPSTHI
jgi:ribose-phosphate pyrophosphokinase